MSGANLPGTSTSRLGENESECIMHSRIVTEGCHDLLCCVRSVFVMSIDTICVFKLLFHPPPLFFGTEMGLVRITSWYQNFDGSHFGSRPS